MMNEEFEFSEDIDRLRASAEAGKQGHTDAQNKLSGRCGEDVPKESDSGKEAEPLGPFTVIFEIAISAFGAASPFVYPEAVDLTPVCLFIIAYLYVFAVVIAAVHKRISKRSKSVMIRLYFLSWATSIVFGLLFVNGISEIAVNGTSGIWMIFSPMMFWGVIFGVKYLKNHWQADKL